MANAVLSATHRSSILFLFQGHKGFSLWDSATALFPASPTHTTHLQSNLPSPASASPTPPVTRVAVMK